MKLAASSTEARQPALFEERQLPTHGRLSNRQSKVKESLGLVGKVQFAIHFEQGTGKYYSCISHRCLSTGDGASGVVADILPDRTFHNLHVNIFSGSHQHAVRGVPVESPRIITPRSSRLGSLVLWFYVHDCIGREVDGHHIFHTLHAVSSLAGFSS